MAWRDEVRVHPSSTELRVLIVSDDFLARAGLAALLAGEPGCVIVGQVAPQDSPASWADVYRPDVVLWDLGWKPAPALEALVDLRDAELPVVALLPDATHATEVRSAGAR